MDSGRLQPALYGGLLIGVLSALPFVSAGNCCCCLWVVAGGMLAVYLRQQNSPFAITSAEGRVFVPKLLVECGLAKSNGEAMRVIAQGGVQVDGKRVEPGTREIEAKSGTTLLIKVGKRHFAKAKVS